MTDEGELWRRWRATNDCLARDGLVRMHIERAKIIAASAYGRRRDPDLSFDDFWQLALLGLLESIDRFDPSRGVQFATFAEKRIKGSVLDGVCRMSERHEQWHMRKRILGEQAVVFPDSNPSIGSALVTALGGTGMIGLGSDGAQVDVAFGEEVERRQRAELLLDSVKRLRLRERTFIWRHYFQMVPIMEIAASEGLSPGRASQIHQKALARLREMLKFPLQS